MTPHPARRRALVVFLVTTGIFVAAAGWMAWTAFRYGDTVSGSARGTVEFDIPRGAGAGQVSEVLATAGLVNRPAVFRLYAGQRGVAGRFKAGHYKVEAPITPKKILDLLVHGAADELVAVVIPEGKNLAEIADLLDGAGITPKAELIAQASDPAFVASLGIPGSSLEGYLFPDTYRLRPRTPASRVIVPMVRRHRQVFEELRRSHAHGVEELVRSLQFDDHKMVVLASIVEKETGQPQERPRIAQVFLNRLRMPSFKPHLLQTDPTIIYGCAVARVPSSACSKWDGRIRRIQLDDKDNPYNTYTHEGLPPGPISNPGRAALEAVMAPDKTPFLYFVSRNDGTHVFSKTIGEHEAAVVKFQRGGKPLAE